jgi:hypothetical protein
MTLPALWILFACGAAAVTAKPEPAAPAPPVEAATAPPASAQEAITASQAAEIPEMPSRRVRLEVLPGAPADLTLIARRHSGQLVYCQENAERRVGPLAGEAQVRVSLEPGVAQRVDYEAAGLDDTEFIGCVTQKIRRWPWPAEATGEVKLRVYMPPPDVPSPE